MRIRIQFLFLFGSLFVAAAAGAGPPADTVREELDRATTRLERLREAYEAGAISRRELEEGEADFRNVKRRLRAATSESRELGPQEARRRVEDARYDFERAAARARRLGELYEAGAAARNETEAAQAAADQAEVYLKLNEELARQVELLASLPAQPADQPGAAGFSARTFFFLQDAFYREFGQPLPVSAFGPSEAHEKMGFDHEGRVDIALHPDSPEGRWLMAQLEIRRIPFVAFRNAVAGKATGAHIHLGFPSAVTGRTGGAAGP